MIQTQRFQIYIRDPQHIWGFFVNEDKLNKHQDDNMDK